MAVPVFWKMAARAELEVPVFTEPKSKLPVSVTPGAMPLPFNTETFGLLRLSEVTVRFVVRAPVALGVKVTASVQLKVAASVKGGVPQVPPLNAKSVGVPPLNATLDTWRVALPVLVRVIVRGLEVVPTFVSANVMIFETNVVSATFGFV